MTEQTTQNGGGKTIAPATPKPPLQAGAKVAAIVPQSIEESFRLANAIAAAGFAPKSYNNDANKIMVGIMHGMEVGLTPMAALQSIAVINGMPSIWGDGALALIRSSGLLESFSETVDGQGDGLRAICTLKRRGEPDAVARHFSVGDAKQAGLWSKQGPWQQYPRRMLQMRARSWAMRDAFADVLKGLGIHEEMRDMGTLVDAGDGTYAPPRPQRADFNPASAGHADLDEQFRSQMKEPTDAPPQSQPGSPSAAEATAPAAQEAQPSDAGGDPGHEAPAQGGDGAQGELIPAAHSFDGEAAYRAAHDALLSLKAKAAVKTFMATDKSVNDIRQNDGDLYENLRQAANTRLKELPA